MNDVRVFTGSFETEREIVNFLSIADDVDSGVERSRFVDERKWKIMTEGRNGPDDAYPGSTAPDDTGGFFEDRDGTVFLTDKAKRCILSFRR